MGMIRLKNVSKYYYNKGTIASGISKVNLDLDIGEFVVITGESGSGKSTLLNVISGLDTYEEGEMYIEGPAIILLRILKITGRNTSLLFSRITI